jgi:catalase
VVPGIDFSNDPLLQGRLFSYLDTQLIRIGPNFAELPINRPLAAVHNNQRDGHMRSTINTGKVSYEPNSLGRGCPMQAPEHLRGYMSYAEKIDAHKVRERSPSFRDHFSQATMFWNSQSDAEKQHIVEAFHFELGKVESKEVRKRVVGLLENVDDVLAARVAEGIGVAAPPNNRSTGVARIAPETSMEHTVQDTIHSRCIAMLAADGFDYAQLTEVKAALQDAGAHPQVVAKYHGIITSTDGQEVEVDKTFVTTGSIIFDAVFIPGGAQSAETLKMQGEAMHFVNEAYKHCKAIAATGEGVDLLLETDMQDIVAEPQSKGKVLSEHGVVTVQNATDMRSLTQKFIEAIGRHRHWERQKEQAPV